MRAQPSSDGRAVTVSVIIPCYHGSRFLREGIESALHQTRAPEQVIVVDDGSTDDSAGIAAGIPGVQLIRQSNRGVSLARNRGLAEATGEFVVFHDADDRLLPSAIEIGIRALQARPECGFVYGFSRTIFEDRAPVDSPRSQVTDASYLRTLEGDTLVPPGCAMFRRTAVESVGGFRDGMFPTEDYDLYLRISRENPIHCHNQTVVEYRMHGGNATNMSSSRALRAALRVLEDQRAFVRGRPELERALELGRAHWGRVFGAGVAFEAIEQLRSGQLRSAIGTLALALRWHARGFVTVARHFARRPSSGARPSER